MNFEQLRSLILQHKVTPHSIVRGPATGQLWRMASSIRGVSREFGLCFSCNGEIATDENLCPHCERLQTVQQFEDQKPIPPLSEPIPKPEPEFVPEIAGPARAALLSEPTIRVHSLSHPDQTMENDVIFNSRPVIAETTERHIPKDDLLTPRDLAKAFQLEFDMPEDGRRYFKIPGQTLRQIKIVIGGTAALVILFTLASEAIRMISATANAGNTPYIKPVAAAVAPAPVMPRSHVAIADARLASDIAVPEPKPVSVSTEPYEAPEDPVPAPAGLKVPAPAPVAAAVPRHIRASAPTSSVLTSVMMVEPTPVQSDEDDPTILLNAGLVAESNGNYAAAVRDYERIQSLPSSQWPPDLKTRLELSRRELKGEIH